MEKTYTRIKDSEYDVKKHGAIDAIRIDVDGAEIKAEIKTVFRYIFTTDWLGIKKYRFLTEGKGFNGYTYFYDERPLKPKWEDIWKGANANESLFDNWEIW